MRYLVLILLFLGLVSAYSAPSYDSVDLVLTSGYTAPSYDSVDLVLRVSDVTDTCTYTSGDWNINCNDNCTITSNVNVGGNDMIFTNIGSFWLKANITNYNQLNLSSGCSMIFDNDIYFVSA